MTTRKAGAALIAVAASAVFTGCSTPGPLHLYSIGPGETEVHDVALDGRDAARDIPSYLEPDDKLTGFAYDPFTDHFFLRLAPGNHIRVVDRPARKIKREFVIAGIPADSAGDLAVYPRTGHLYLIDPAGPAVFESTRLGEFVRRINLQGRSAPAAAIAFDATRDHLLVLDGDGRTIQTYTPDGSYVGRFTTERAIAPSLAFDPDRRELYAPLADQPAVVGVFDGSGRLLRSVPIRGSDRFIDVGPHSFLRIF